MPSAFVLDPFIELGRRFVKQEETGSAEERADSSYLSSDWWLQDRQLQWTAILSRPRVVILGEAGSGKTREMLERARRLAADGQAAYFIRLDELAGTNLDAVLTPESYIAFQSDLNSGQPVSLFLDSVDEAKLISPASFRTALKHLRSGIPVHAVQRVRIYLSTRISAWNADVELPMLRDLFGSGPKLQKVTSGEDENDGGAMSRPTAADWEVFKIAALDREQVAKLAAASGIPDTNEFLRSIDASHAWEFARRPSDVKPLARYWAKYRRLGTLTDLIEFDVTQKLRESRTEADTLLSDEDARVGAETLAAAAVLCHAPAISLPASNTPDALEGRACLPADSWTGNKQAALLDRPIFDEAHVGKVRFHHRRVREYLGARWIERQMHAGCPLHELEDIFFDRVAGVRVMRDSLAPVAAWLCGGDRAWNGFMRKWVRETRPEIVLRYGDPHALTPQFRRELLQDLVARAKSARHLWLSSDEATLSRFGHEEIGPDLAAVASDTTLAGDLRSAALDIIRLCGLKNCTQQTLAIFTDDKEEDRIRVEAGRALVAIADDTTRAAMAAYLLRRADLDMALVGIAAEDLWSRTINNRQLVDLLSKIQLRDEIVSGLEWQVVTPMQSKLSAHDAGELAPLVITLLHESPCFPADRELPPISQKYSWLRPLMRLFAAKMMDGPALAGSDARLVAECITLADAPHGGEQSPDPLGIASKSHPFVRQAYLWRRVELARAQQKREVEGWWDLSFAGNFRLSPTIEDVDWLVADTRSAPTREDRVLALRLAWGVAQQAGVPRSIRKAIRLAAMGDDSLTGEYERLERQQRLRPIRRLQSTVRDSVLQRFWWRRQSDRVRRGVAKWRSRWFLFRNRAKLRQGQLIHVLAKLAREADPENQGAWAPAKWSGVDKKWGERTRAAARTGCKRAWRQYTPQLPHEKTPQNRTSYEVIVGLAGIQAEWTDGELDFEKLTATEVQQLTRYAAEEMNGFPEWFQSLVDSLPAHVGPVLAISTRGEWTDPHSEHGEPDVIRKLTRINCEKLVDVRDALADCFAAGDPANAATLGPAISVMMNCGQPGHEVLALQAEKRAIDPVGAPAIRARWLSVLLTLRGPAARPHFERASSDHKDADLVITAVCAYLSGRLEDRAARKADSTLTTPILAWLIPLVYRHVRPKDDIHHSGAYTPSARDEAQRLREGLIDRLAQQVDPEVPRILADFAIRPEFATYVDWLRHARVEALQRAADLSPWQPQQIRQFAVNYAKEPVTAHDLFQITLNRVKDVKKELEESHSRLRNSIGGDVKEAELRRWLADRLEERARQQFTSPQESVIADEQRPDIRVQHPVAGSISIEIKWATDWSFNELKDALEDQLVARYLRAHNSNHGILVLGRHSLRKNADKTWASPSGALDFPGLQDWLCRRAAELETEKMHVKRIEVVTLYFEPN
jgi:hypothetical protein